MSIDLFYAKDGSPKVKKVKLDRIVSGIRTVGEFYECFSFAVGCLRGFLIVGPA